MYFRPVENGGGWGNGGEKGLEGKKQERGRKGTVRVYGGVGGRRRGPDRRVGERKSWGNGRREGIK